MDDSDGGKRMPRIPGCAERCAWVRRWRRAHVDEDQVDADGASERLFTMAVVVADLQAQRADGRISERQNTRGTAIRLEEPSFIETD